MDKLSYFESSDQGLVLHGPNGAEFTLEVTPELRAAVRQVAPTPEPEPLPPDVPDTLRPKDIQALVRAGASPEELAERSGQDAAYIARYAAPVLDERLYIAELAQAIPMDGPDGTLTLAELATQRLEPKGIDPETLTWDASYQDGAWVARLSFATDRGPRSGRWSLDLQRNTVLALDQTAEWITEPEPPDAPVPPPTRHLNAVADDVGGVAEQVADAAPLSLLDNQMDARGLRQVAPTDPAEARADLGAPGDVVEFHRPTPDNPLELITGDPPMQGDPDMDGDLFAEDGPLAAGYPAGPADATTALPAYSTYALDDDLPETEAQDQVETERVSIKDRAAFHEPTLADAHQEAEQDPLPPEPKPRSRAKRSSVPSWDEIVFGASRNDT
jgi:hypothetical protein